MKKAIFLAPFLLLLLSGCGILQFNSSTPEQLATPTGFYRTTDRGATWDAKMDIYSIGGQGLTFAGTNITTMVLDPNDSNTIYLGTENRGLIYSYNGGDAWFYTAPTAGVVNAVAVDYSNKCTVYVAIFNRVYKTTDCNRTWQEIHLSSVEGEFFTSLAVDPHDNRIVYLGTSRGTLLKSLDAGFSWQVNEFFNDRVAKIIVNPNDSTKVFVATGAAGIFYSADSAGSWQSLLDREVLTNTQDVSEPNKLLNSFGGANILLSLAFDYTQNNGLIYSSNYGIFRLLDSGQWQEISILNKPNEESVIAIGVNPKNGQEIYFTTTGAFYQTVNNGVDWTVKPLISAGLPQHLIINPDKPDSLYLGFYQPR